MLQRVDAAARALDLLGKQLRFLFKLCKAQQILADRAKLEQIDTLTTEVDFDIFLFRKGL